MTKNYVCVIPLRLGGGSTLPWLSSVWVLSIGLDKQGVEKGFHYRKLSSSVDGTKF